MRSNDVRNTKWFTAAAVFAGVLLGAHFADAVRPAAAGAQPDNKNPEFKSPFNSAEDRKQNIDQLREINTRLGRIEAQLKSGLSVKVTEMPTPKDK